MKKFYSFFSKNIFLAAILTLCSVQGWGQTYTQVTTTAQLTDGDYLIVGDGTNDGLMINTITAATPYINYSAISNPGTTITTGFTVDNVFEVTVVSGVITIYQSSVGYVSWGRTGNTGNTATFYSGTVATTEQWTATVSGGLWTLANVATSTRLLQWNSGSPRFAAYTSAQVKLKLYKKSSIDFYWNGTTTTGTGPAIGGNGTWVAGSNNWISSTNNASGIPTNWTNSTTNAANFANGSGTVTMGTSITAGNTIISASGYTFAPNATLSLISPVTLTQSLTVAPTTGTTFTMSGALSGAGGITQNGAGTLILSGSSSYTGATAVTLGILQLGATGTSPNSPLGTTGAGTSVSSGMALDLNGFTLATAEPLTINGTGISNGGALINSSATAVNFSGPITLAGNSSIGTTGNITLTAAVGGGAYTLTKRGNGILTLNAVSTYTGATTITSGTLRLGVAHAIRRANPGAGLVLNGGTLSTGATTGFSDGTSATDNMGTLTLSDNSIIALGTGNHSLYFANSNAASWDNTKTLSITGWSGSPGASNSLGGKIFIGNNASGLSLAQKDRIQFDGYDLGSVIQLSTGEIVPVCATITTFPFIETFEAASATRPCWGQEQVTGTANWTYATGAGAGAITTAYAGTLNARFVSQSPAGGAATNPGSPVTKLISPVMDITSLTNPKVTFWYGQELWSPDQNSLKVYYRTSSVGSWVELQHFTGNINTWTEASLDLPNASATYQIAFEGLNRYGRANVLDNVTVASSIPCSAPTNQPTNLVLSNATTTTIDGAFTAASPAASGYLVVASTSATLSGNPADATVYNVNDALGGGIVVYAGNGTSFTAAGLNQNTTYYFFVFAYNNTACGGGPKYLVTSPLTGTEATLEGPCISEDFTGFTDGAPSDWDGTGCSNYNTAGNYGPSGANSAQFNSTGDNLITPSLAPGSEAQSLSFWIKGNGTDAASAFLVEGYNGSWVTIENITSIPTTGVTKLYNSSSTPALPSGIIQFRFTYTKSAGNVAFDDVRIYCGSAECSAAASITTHPADATVVVPNTATYSVTATGGALSYQWQVSDDCGVTWNNIGGANSASYTTPATTLAMNGYRYRVIVDNDCGDPVTSDAALLTVVNSNVGLDTYITSAAGWDNHAYAATDWRTFPTQGDVTNSGTWYGELVYVDATGNERIQIPGDNTNRWLQTPPVNSPISITINAMNSSSTATTVTLGLEYSTDGINFYNAAPNISVNGPNDLGYRDFTYDVSSLSALSGVYFKFVNPTGSNTIYIKRITINKTDPPATPTTYTWTGDANTTKWVDPCNWSPKGVPTAIDNVIFTNNTGVSNSLILTDSRTVTDFTLNNFGHFSLSATGTLTINGDVDYNDTNGATATFDCDSQVNIKSPNPQIVPWLTYGNLDILGGNRTFQSGKTIKICSGFNVEPDDASTDLYTYTIAGSTVEYISGESGWIMTPFTYHNLIFSGTGDFSLGYSDPAENKTVNVLGDFTQSAGTVYLGETSTKTATLNINGNATFSGGTFDMNYYSGGTGILNLKGDLSVLSGAALMATNGTTANFNFSGTGDGLTPENTQTIDVANNATASNITFNVNSGAYAKLETQSFTLGSSSKFTVAGTFDFGFNVVNNPLNLLASGSLQTFTNLAGSTLKITSPDGITTDANLGNVQTPVAGRTYNPDGIYHYIGKIHQASGNGLPGTASAKKVIVELATTNTPANDNLNFTVNGLKYFTDNGELEIRKGTVIDAPSNGFADGTSEDGKLTMNGGRYKISRTSGSTQPSLGGDYTLTGGVIEFTGGNMFNIRTNKEYLNVEVTGTNVTAGTTDTAGLTIKPTGTFTVKNGGVFKVNNLDGFSGGASTAIKSINNPEITLDDGSTIEYSRPDDQTINAFKPLAADNSNLTTGGYYNLKITGDNGASTAKTLDATSPVYVRNNLVVDDSNSLLKIEADKAIIINKQIINNATAANFVIESDGNLLQINDAAVNTGNITAKRDLTLSTTHQQYNYLISPTEGTSLSTIYGAVPVPYVLYHQESNNKFYASSGAYIKGRGLAVKEPATGTMMPATFIGKPANGAFPYTIVNSNLTDPNRGFNLIGNPYPSNIDLVAFYTLNGGSGGNLDSTAYFWDNKANNRTTQEGDAYGGQSYGQLNMTTGTGTAGTGDVGATTTPIRYVKTAQGFMVKSKATSATINFNNTIRTATAGTGFFGKNSGDDEMNRYWLNMINPENIASNIAVVYFPEGNNGFTQDDSRSMGGSDAVYSLVDEEKVSINGKSVFQDTDVVQLGTSHFASGNYILALDKTEGIFANGQNIYLKDNQTGIITNLSQGNYTFAANAGANTGRFEIIYKPETVLATDGNAKEEITVYRDGNDFVVKSVSKKITALECYDAAGRLMIQLSPNQKEVRLNAAAFVNGVYLLKINRNGEMTTKKVMR